MALGIEVHSTLVELRSAALLVGSPAGKLRPATSLWMEPSKNKKVPLNIQTAGF